jgi:hypothetical protein
MDTKDYRIETKQLPNRWVEGKIGDYRFQAKVYDIGSHFGIDGGRISKLAVWDEGPGGLGEIISYDRGWDKEPAAEEHISILQAIVEHFKLKGESRNEP